MNPRFVFLWCGFFVVHILADEGGNEEKQPPHIIIIMADDLGWNDVSFHGSKLFLTPNIDALAYNGIILNDFHSPSLCTPSRASLLTGKFPINIGMQQNVILEAEPRGLPQFHKILPQYLNSVGYESHLVGKWHLGFYEQKYTPTYRGFKSFFGFWQGHHDYFSHLSHETFDNFVGYDFRENQTPRKDLKDFYTSDLLNAKSVNLIENHDPSKPLFLFLSHIAPHAGEPGDPLQAPEDVIERFSYIPDENKRKYAAMVSKLDECVGDVMKALNQKNMLENSIVLFTSDNGGPTIGIHSNTASNYPLRGIKATEFEGGTRVPAIIWSPLFKKQQRVSNIMMHMVDVLPTLCTAAGINPSDFEDIDGISMWDTLLQGSEQSLRTEYPYNIDPADENKSAGAIRVGDWKYYKGDIEVDADSYSWLGNNFASSEFEKFNYDIVQIIHSETNTAIIDFYQQNEDDVDWEPIDSTKILQLREETIVKCPNLKHLPQCTANHSCLLNLKEDLCERYDYSSLHPREYENLKQKFEEYRSKVVEPLNKPRDHCANPEYWNGVWSSWHDFDIIFENLSVRGKYWQSLYLYAFAWHYRQSALCSCGDSVTFNEGRK